MNLIILLTPIFFADGNIANINILQFFVKLLFKLNIELLDQ